MISVVTFIGLGILTKSKLKFDDRKLLLFGLALVTISMMTITPYPFESTLPLWQLIISATMLSVGYPVASALCFALFAKVINPVGQGTKMGYLTAVGSLARMLGPLWATSTLSLGKNEGEVLFMITAALVLAALVLLLVTFKRMVPHPDYEPPTGAPEGNVVTNSVHSFTGTASSFTTPNGSPVKARMLYSTVKTATVNHAISAGAEPAQKIEITAGEEWTAQLMTDYLHPAKVEKEAKISKPKGPGRSGRALIKKNK